MLAKYSRYLSLSSQKHFHGATVEGFFLVIIVFNEVMYLLMHVYALTISRYVVKRLVFKVYKYLRNLCV